MMTKEEIKKRINYINKRLHYISGAERLKSYNSGDRKHLKQIEFHKCTKRNRWVFGGNRSGKTECGAVETIWLCRGIHPYKKNKKDMSCWVVSLSTQVQREVAQSKILSYLDPSWIKDIVMLSGKRDNPESGVIDTIYIYNVFGSVSKIGFRSVDQGREKFQGTSLDFVWFDEEPPYDIYLECKMRVLDRKGEVFGTMTPLKGLTWVYHDIYQNEKNDDSVWSTSMSWEDNPYLDKDEIESLSSVLSEDELRARKYGEFTAYGGLVYSNFSDNVNAIDPFVVPKEWYDNISIDPGLNNPLSCHWYAVDYDGNVYVIAEHYEAKRDIEYHANKIKEISKGLGWKTNSSGQISALIDSAANQHTLTTPKSVAELFYDLGISVNTRVNKDLFSGISRVKNYIKNVNGVSRLFIFKTCKEMIREIKGYFWGNNDAPNKHDDHSMDELRYYIMNRPDTPIVVHEKSLITKDKEKLIKRLRR